MWRNFQDRIQPRLRFDDDCRGRRHLLNARKPLSEGPLQDLCLGSEGDRGVLVVLSCLDLRNGDRREFVNNDS